MLSGVMTESNNPEMGGEYSQWPVGLSTVLSVSQHDCQVHHRARPVPFSEGSMGGATAYLFSDLALEELA